MPRASALADPLANSSAVFDHRESVSTRRRISIETGDCAQRCSSCLSAHREAHAGCCAVVSERFEKTPCGCRARASSPAGALGVLACLAVTMTLVVVTLQHELAPPKPSPPLPPVSRCSAGVDRTYKVERGESCSQISRARGVPWFDIVDRNTTRTCCESDAIEAEDILEFCKPPRHSGWMGRGLPEEKLVMTYIGGIGSLAPPPRYGSENYSAPRRTRVVSPARVLPLPLSMDVLTMVCHALRMPESVNVAALVCS